MSGALAKDPVIHHVPVAYLNVETLKEHLQEKFSTIKDLKIVAHAFDAGDYGVNTLILMAQEEDIEDVIEYIHTIDNHLSICFRASPATASPS